MAAENIEIILKKSSVAGKVPLPADLQPAEPAFNLADKTLYTKDTNGNIIEIGGIDDDEITGAYINDAMGIWDETDNYAVSDVVWWKGNSFECISPTVGSIRGDLNAAPDVTGSNWSIIVNTIFSVYPTSPDSSTSQNYADVTYDAIRYGSPDFTLNTGNGQVTANKSNIYLVALTNSMQNNGNDRSTSTTKMQINKQDGNGFVDVPNLELFAYHRNSQDEDNSVATTIVIPMNQGWILKTIFAEQDSSGGVSTIPDGCQLTIWSNRV